jgi:hypothetical protein
LGNGNGTFRSAVTYGLADDPTNIAVGDVDGDGNLDLAITSFNARQVNVLFGRGDGTFGRVSTINVGRSPLDIQAGDFNGDGNLDLAVMVPETDALYVYLGNGHGGFQLPLIQAVGANPSGTRVVDGVTPEGGAGDGHCAVGVGDAAAAVGEEPPQAHVADPSHGRCPIGANSRKG